MPKRKKNENKQIAEQKETNISTPLRHDFSYDLDGQH